MEMKFIAGPCVIESAELLDEVAERFDKVITVEDGSVRGGVGEAVAA